MTLNEMPDIKPPNRLCPTDSRLRPDVRKLELGDIDGAALEKTRLEEKQRDSRKAMKARKEEWKPKSVISLICNQCKLNQINQLIKKKNIFKIIKNKKQFFFTRRWFALGTNPNTGLTDWIYNGEYWNRNYDEIDIF